jgi:hypothetical protein
MIHLRAKRGNIYQKQARLRQRKHMFLALDGRPRVTSESS